MAAAAPAIRGAVAPVLPLEHVHAAEMEGCYVPFAGEAAPAPRILRWNAGLARSLGLDPALGDAPEAARWLTGGHPPEGARPLAMAYAGHQFGGFSPQLGDGRALLLGEMRNPAGALHDLHLKGSGRTPFSRGGDGKAALGPVLREYLMGEAMHALGIPTTRALAASVTGETVVRDTGPQPGAVLARVASSHLRVGTFQIFAARGEGDRLRQLLDHAVRRHDPDLAPLPLGERATNFLGRVIGRQARLIAQWMAVGFVHGVMNTDNMALSGETIDYGPCAFIDAYAAGAVFSSIDHGGRYAFGAQPGIAQWNLARLAEAMLGLIDTDEDRAVATATEALTRFAPLYRDAWLDLMREKLGLADAREGDLALAEDLYAAIEGQGVDHTGLFRSLGQAVAAQDLSPLPQALGTWAPRWHERAAQDTRPPAVRAAAMDAVNPAMIPRNHLVEAALAAAVERSDLAPFDRLMGVLATPFTVRPGDEAFTLPAPPGSPRHRTYCGT